ncbi:cyclic-phosphate processing receiver domain-containing protein [Paenibacillus alkaliterrae]|uniref:cyclic-phosphate processing receiver domain-containing protein n=1 Tax=Paenibacillus alkaliterrae TaxID=320909 RepID=UPI0038B407EE
MDVFLDDKRRCPPGFCLVRTAKDCIALLKTNTIATLSLDYNLGYGKPTGYEVAKYMTANNVYADKIIIHSADSLGRHRMFRLLQKHKPEHVLIYIRPAIK